MKERKKGADLFFSLFIPVSRANGGAPCGQGPRLGVRGQ
jgi:hypothetical protein